MTIYLSSETTSDYLPYTYLIEWTHLSIRYYGARWAKDCNPADFWVDYFTSSERVADFVLRHGEPDRKEIRKIFPGLTPSQSTADLVAGYEGRVLTLLNAAGRPDYLNANNGMRVGYGSTIGTKWYTNGATFSLYAPGSEPDGWTEGFILKGKRWYSNGVEAKRFVPGTEPEGYILGSQLTTCNGLKQYNNGVEQKMFVPGEEPEGWESGRLSSDYRQYTNGTDCKKFIPGTEPAGWERGFPANVGKLFFTNGDIAKKFVPGKEPAGWKRGRSPNQKNRKKINTR